MKNVIFNIQHFCVKDGPGIRTTVFLKGCPLNCLWCHNPESKSNNPIIMLNNSKCIGCKVCANVCSAHTFTFGEHLIDREKCSLCGKCIENCCGALEICGEEKSVEDIIKEVLQDVDFYKNSGGGLTISGGEPLANVSFTNELLLEAKKYNLHTAVETCGYAKWEDVNKIASFVDLFLFDIKETNATLHKTYTGVDNNLIFQNLRKLNDIGAKIVLRCPIIPSYNDREDHFKAIAELANELRNVLQIEILPYHPMGQTKSQQLGIDYLVKGTFPLKEEVEKWRDTISLFTTKTCFIK